MRCQSRVRRRAGDHVDIDDRGRTAALFDPVGVVFLGRA